MKLQPLTRIIIILSLVFLNIGCDQISKSLVRERISEHERIQVIQDSLILMKVENTGAAYSIGSNLNPIAKKIILQIIPAIVLLVLLVILLTSKDYTTPIIVGFSFIVGGGIGNVFDRIAHGSVTDFLYVDLGFFSTEIFNMADVSIVFGTILVILFSIFDRKKEVEPENDLV